MNSATRKLINLARQIDRYNTGYGQGAKERASCFDFANKAILKNRMVDCSMAYAGLVDMAYGTSVHKGTVWTGNIASKLKATGFFRVERFRSLSQVQPGGALLTPGHHISTMLDSGEMLSPEGNERGRTTGGRPGDQTGREVKIRKLYNRPGGWALVINPIPTDEFKGHALALFGKAASLGGVMGKLRVVAEYDAPLYQRFFTTLEGFMAGLDLAYSAADLGTVPQARHAFVVLGSALHPDGSMTAKYRRRLDLAVDGLKANPGSAVLVSGGKAHGGVTEARAGALYLVSRGVDQARIIAETQSNSTVGNALYSVPLLRRSKINYVTLVSDASHLRRAMALFAASILRVETADNTQLHLGMLRPLGYRDSLVGTKSASAVTRAEIAREAAAVLGLTRYYK